MSNQLSYLLKQWQEGRDSCQWVLGTVYKTEGPAYRKAGAMMLFNSLGQQFGMLSGGCLESDIQSHARRVMQNGQALSLCYDGTDEDDLSFQLGIGCGGKVYILLQAITEQNNFLELNKLAEALENRQYGIYHQFVPKNSGSSESRFQLLKQAPDYSAQLDLEGDDYCLHNVIVPEPHLLLVGGGIDARPVVELAHGLGWKTSVWDPRPANARREFFLQADALLRFPVEKLAEYVRINSVNAVVLMSHNLDMDAEALEQFHKIELDYLALLGPMSRKTRVINKAGLDAKELKLAGPAGLDIGAELPESIALAILAECHAAIKCRSAKSLSDVLE